MLRPMIRREFIYTMSSSLLALGLGDGLTAYGLSKNYPSELDPYGGWKQKRFKATGYFRVEKENRWWLVTPNGNAFLSFGVNHFHRGWWKQPYNREIWMQNLGIQDEAQMDEALRSWFIDVCRRYGFNTVGVHSDRAILNNPQPKIPYVQAINFVDISHWKNSVVDEDFVDIFSDEFYQHCDQLSRKEVQPLKDDPFLLGYAMADCPLFTEEDCRHRTDTIYGGRRKSRIGWPRRLRNLGSDAPGKRAYVQTMSKLYGGNIQGFNRVYLTSFDSFAALAEAQQWRPESDLSNGYETRDNVEFLKKCVDQYYKTASDAIRRYDENHLFFGDKLNGNTDTVDTVLRVTANHTDVLFYQMYATYDTQQPSLDRWSKKVDIPIINGDSAYTHLRERMPKPYGPIADSEDQNAAWTQEFFTSAFSRPEFVGWHLCGLIDTPVKLVKKESDRQHSGLFNGFGEAYPKLRDVIMKCSHELYQIASK